MRTIRKDTLRRGIDFLNEVNLHLKSNPNIKSVTVGEIARKHRFNSALFYYSVQVGIYERLSVGRYRILVDKIEPFHVKKALQLSYKKTVDKWRKKSNVGDTKQLTSDEMSEKKQQAVDNLPRLKPTNTDTKLKTFSLFWGLIKFNY